MPVINLTGFAEKGSESAIAVGSGLCLETEDYID